MQVFISWSGSTSRELGEALRNWIPSVLQSVQPYFTPSDIDKGTRWQSDIAGKLEGSKIGILCLTRESLNKPWLMFEAGALSKTISGSKVCPILFGIDATDLEGPLVQFQSTEFVKADIKKLMATLNAESGLSGDKQLDDEVFEKVFHKWWPDLEAEIKGILLASTDTNASEQETEIRTDREIMEEMLALNRRMATQQVGRNNRRIPAGLFRDLFGEYEAAIDLTRKGLRHAEILTALQAMQPALAYLLEKVFTEERDARLYRNQIAHLSFTSLVPPNAPDFDEEIPF